MILGLLRGASLAGFEPEDVKFDRSGVLVVLVWYVTLLRRSDKCYFDCSREPPPIEDAQEPSPEPEPEQLVPQESSLSGP
jgi:hypothetical protein